MKGQGRGTAFRAAASSFAAGKWKSNTSGRKSKDRQIAQGYYEQERAK